MKRPTAFCFKCQRQRYYAKDNKCGVCKRVIFELVANVPSPNATLRTTSQTYKRLCAAAKAPPRMS